MPDEFGQHKEKYPDVPFIEHVALMVRAVQVEAEVRHKGYVEFSDERHRAFVELYRSEQILKDQMITKAEEANKTHFALINGLQNKQDMQQRDHAADLIRVRAEMASTEALQGTREQLEVKIAAVHEWKIQQEAMLSARDKAIERRQWMVGLFVAVFSVLIATLLRLMGQ